ncbi:MAG: hypothetical protein ACYCVN_02780 [Acidimicrobiales bacterium]
MEVVEQGSPTGVMTEESVTEADDRSAGFDDHREPILSVLAEPFTPHGPAVADHLTIEEGVRVGTAVVPPPTVGVQRGDGLRIECSGDPTA